MHGATIKIIINVYRSSRKITLLLSVVNKTSIFWTHFRKKQLNITFHESPLDDSRVVPRGRTDRYDEANRRFS